MYEERYKMNTSFIYTQEKEVGRDIVHNAMFTHVAIIYTRVLIYYTQVLIFFHTCMKSGSRSNIRTLYTHKTGKGGWKRCRPYVCETVPEGTMFSPAQAKPAASEAPPEQSSLLLTVQQCCYLVKSDRGREREGERERTRCVKWIEEEVGVAR